MRDKKKLLIATLLVLVCIMTIGYALLAQELQITGTTAIGSTWDIKITNIREKEKSVGASSKEEPTYDATTATFNAGFTSPGDYITYEVEISNLGTLDAIIDSINLNGEDTKAIKYTISGIKKGNLVPGNSKKYLELNIQYNDKVKDQPSVLTSSIALTINCVEYFGNEETNNESDDLTIGYEYEVGDKISFAGSNWYVIRNSKYNDDYVTLLKENSLTSNELGNNYSLKYRGDTLDKMALYWGEKCNESKNGYQYGEEYYTNTTSPTLCAAHTDTSRNEWYAYNYSTSKIKEMLENQYILTLNEQNLKEVNGYKIRLINESDLGNFSCYIYPRSLSLGSCTNKFPTWFIGEKEYITMIKHEYIEHDRWGYYYYYWTITIKTDGSFGGGAPYIGYNVRPVINLYKSAIE